MKKYLSFIFFLGFQSLYAQPADVQNMPLDSLFVYLAVDLDSLIHTHRYEETYEKAYLALGRSKLLGEPDKIAKAHKIIADWHYYSITSQDPDSVYYHDLKCLEYLIKTNDQEKIAKAHDRVGKDLMDISRFLEAEQHIFEEVRIYESLGNQLKLASAYSSLNALYRSSKDYDEALLYGEKSLLLFEANKEQELDLIEPLLGLIKTYPKVGKSELALEKAQQVVEIIRRKYGEEDNIHLANVRSWRGEVYLALGDYTEAQKDFLYSWNVIKSLLENEKDADGWKGDIGNTLRLQGNYGEAIPYIKDALIHHHSKNIFNTEKVEDYQFWLADCYQNLNQLDSAVLYLSKAQTLQNNRLTEELAAVRSELRIKYDSDQKETTISNQYALIQYQQNKQYLSLGIGGLLLLLLAGVLYTYRNNRQKNQQLHTLNENLTITNGQLDQRNEQNELLLKEIHHRVKNNLEIVSSLLELQSSQIDDKGIKDAMQEGQNRVHSIGIVHKKLYQGQNLGAIEMKDYFVNLSESILDSFGAEDRVTIECAMDVLDLDIDTAVPLGLIVNELLTNTLKYAFPDGRKGNVSIQLIKKANNILHLKVADDGIGKSGSIQGTGFGGQLVTLLTSQLQGSMREEVKNGTTIFIDFNLKKAV